MPALDFAAVGDNCIDKFLDQGWARVGGNALNVAVHIAKSENNSFYFGAVGNDTDGIWTKDVLMENDVDVKHLQFLPEITAYTNINHGPEGDRIFAFEEFGACAAYRPSAEDIDHLRTMSHVHVGWFKGTDMLCTALADTGVTLSRDIAVNDEGGPMDVVFGSVGESFDLARKELARLLQQGHQLAVVTCGALGSIASNGKEEWQTVSDPVDVIDTTGAGDTYIANFLVNWRNGADIEEALKIASKIAAQTCTHLGGFPQQGHGLFNNGTV
jgi:fructoselysine 6-kinase|tara:strand:- start:266 stop:1078 length:813 start_codon:yes stop_codon:yes gene_type:complete